MKKLYAPWRGKYVTKADPKSTKDEKDCIFCFQLNQNDDEKYFILKRFEHSFAILNLYPYNGGHLMILPNRHEKDLDKLFPEERTDLMEASNISVKVISKTMAPSGFNLGLNLGESGGGGIPSHLHIHILPRWKSDTNFLATIFDTKIISTDIKQTYEELIKEFKKV